MRPGRVLQVDKFLRRQGGAPAYMLELAELQRRAGIEVEFYAMADEGNLPARFADDFAPPMELSAPAGALRAKAVTAARMVWNRPAARGIGRVLDHFRPEVVHVHNVYHQLSPSILAAVASRDIPLVMTVHDPKLVCTNYHQLAGDEVCTRCTERRTFVPALRTRCVDGSLAASAVLAVEGTIHRLARLYGPVDRFICPSRYLLDQLRRGGVFPDRLVHVPHGIDTSDIAPGDGAGDGLLFVGRLTPEKGVHQLIDAVVRHPELRLTILGDGPERAALSARAEATGGRIRVPGPVPKAEVVRAMRASRAVIVPSTWPENQPMAILEAMAAARPVVATDLGGSAELVHDGETGLVVPAGDVAALGAALTRLAGDPALAERLGRAGRRAVVERHAPDHHLAAVLDVYAEASGRHRAPRPG